MISTALGAGLVGAVTIIAFRLLAGPGGSDEQTVVRFVVYLAIATAVGWVAAFGMSLLRPGTGLAVGVVVLPIATTVTTAGLFAMNAALGGGVDLTLLTTALLGPAVAGLFLLLLAAPLTWFARGRDRGSRVAVVTTPIAAVAAVLVLAAGTAVGPAVGSVVSGVAGPQPDAGTAVTEYQLVVGNLVQRHEQVRAELGAVLQDPTLDEREQARRLRADVIPLADALLAVSGAFLPPTPEIGRAHRPAMAAAEAARESVLWLATALETADVDLLARAEARWSDYDAEYGRWADAVAELPFDR